MIFAAWLLKGKLDRHTTVGIHGNTFNKLLQLHLV